MVLNAASNVTVHPTGQSGRPLCEVLRRLYSLREMDGVVGRCIVPVCVGRICEFEGLTPARRVRMPARPRPCIERDVSAVRELALRWWHHPLVEFGSLPRPRRLRTKHRRCTATWPLAGSRRESHSPKVGFLR